MELLVDFGARCQSAMVAVGFLALEESDRKWVDSSSCRFQYRVGSVN